MSKTIYKVVLLAVLVSPVIPFSVSAEMSVSGNAGILSDYIFRGIPQDSGVANGGIDLEAGGFYLGTWIADVGEGIEQDFYTGYVMELPSGLYLGAGFTSYQYSDDFDDEYNEVNLYAGWASDALSLDLEYTDGEYNGVFTELVGGQEVDQGDEYGFFAATLGFGGAYLTYGDFTDDADEALGDYLELGYSLEVSGFEVTAAVVRTDADVLQIQGAEDDDETEAYISIHHSFDLM